MMRVPFSYEDFVSILNSLYSVEVQLELQLERRNQFYSMVFGNVEDFDNSEAASRIQAVRAAGLVKMLGKGVIRVVRRMDEAKANNELDLSNCQLMQVPDAVYYMMRNTPLIACNLSSNVITKITPKLPAKFTFIKHLNLSHNRLSGLPSQMTEMVQLESADISHNAFLQLPECLFNMARLNSINAKKNFIADVNCSQLKSCPRLTHLNLEENPLSRECEAALAAVPDLTLNITLRETEEWEDLSTP